MMEEENSIRRKGISALAVFVLFFSGLFCLKKLGEEVNAWNDAANLSSVKSKLPAAIAGQAHSCQPSLF